MCRHLSYLGAPVTLAELLIDPPHALLRQSWAPRDMRGGGTVNADGFGVGWFAEDPGAPIRYRRSSPMWTDTTFAQFARGELATVADVDPEQRQHHHGHAHAKDASRGHRALLSSVRSIAC